MLSVYQERHSHRLQVWSAGMSARPWYKRYASDFIAGTISLTLEEAGAYSYIIDLLHDRGGPIPDDAQWIARVCGCSTRKWKTIRQRLIQAGKIYENEGALLAPIARKWLRFAGRETTPQNLRILILARDNHQCQYCGVGLQEDNFHCDHIIPHSQGGDTNETNLVAACPTCNLRKGAKTPEEWLQ